MEVLDEPQGTGQGLDGRPTEVLELAPGGEVVLDREGRREVGEEGEEMRGGFSLSWMFNRRDVSAILCDTMVFR